MEPIADILIAALIVLGGAFALIGSWGLARLPDLMTRLHGPTKATTLGVGGCLIASMVYFPTHGMALSFHELLVTLFLFITAPITANMIAKAHLHQRKIATDGGRDGARPPAPGKQSDWATFGPPHRGENPQG